MFRNTFTLTALLAALLPKALPAVTVQDVLAQMDQSAAGFKGMSANLRSLKHTHVIDDNSEESGSVLLRKTAPHSIQVLVNFTKPDERTVAFGGKRAEIYYPKLKTVQEYNLAQHSALIHQFMALGFGASGRELAASYDVKLAGEETVAGGKAVKLELTPKTAAAREKLKRVELWMAEGGAYPVQQKFLQPSGDYTTFTYTDVKLNPAVGADALKLRLPKGVKRETPQK
ncbi:MAG TPA: outer membrane lipoprotein carrier protein LolA [Bryobacteraceae bacterium]|nr:outer membrane lipoprotein carrier protein LolA [Bryobacteraceae bacterium]